MADETSPLVAANYYQSHVTAPFASCLPVSSNTAQFHTEALIRHSTKSMGREHDRGIHIQIQSVEPVARWGAALQSLTSITKRCLRQGATTEALHTLFVQCFFA